MMMMDMASDEKMEESASMGKKKAVPKKSAKSDMFSAALSKGMRKKKF